MHTRENSNNVMHYVKLFATKMEIVWQQFICGICVYLREIEMLKSKLCWYNPSSWQEKEQVHLFNQPSIIFKHVCCQRENMTLSFNHKEKLVK